MKNIYADSRRVSRFLAAQADPLDILAAEIGPAFAAYRASWEEARAFKRPPPFPLHVDYEMKFACPLSCPMCLMSLPGTERRAYGDPDQSLTARTVMEMTAEGAAQGQKALGFGGLWEPLLSPDLPEIISFARASGLVDVMLSSSGLLLTEKIALALMEAGLTRLMISLDAASPAVYERMRPGSDFRTVIDNILNFLKLRKKRRLPLLRLSFCLTALNEAELPPFLERWAGRADFISVQAYGRYPTPEAPPFPSAPAGTAPAGTATAGTAPAGTAPAADCAQPFKRLLVRHNGLVVPCCDLSGLGLALGHIAEKSLSELWRGEKLAALRRSLRSGAPPAPCSACQDKFGGPAAAP